MQEIKLADLKKKYPDLSKVEGSITKILENNFKRLNSIYEDPNVSDEEFKEIVLMVIYQARDTGPTGARKRILDNLEHKTGRQDIFTYLYNIWLKGQNMGVI